jgi:hypothetical protein
LLSLLLYCCGDNAAIKKGSIHYELNVETKNDTGDTTRSKKVTGSPFFGGYKINVYMKSGKTLVNFNIMDGAVIMSSIITEESDSVNMYVETMGQKYKVKYGGNSFTNEEVKIINVELFKDDRKTIAGYDTYRADVDMTIDGKNINSTVYITEDLRLFRNSNKGMANMKELIINADRLNGIKGTILEQKINIGGSLLGEFTMKATEISTEVNESIFDINEEEYTVITEETFKNLGGSLGLQ